MSKKKKKQRHDFADKSLCSQSYDFSSGHVQMWELDHKEGWAPKNWCFQIVMLENTLESPLDSKEIKPANPKKNHLWTSIGRMDAEAEAPILWPPDSLEKTLILGKIEGMRRRGQQRVRWLDGINALECTQCTWVWANSGRQCRTWKPGMLQSMGWQRVGHDWATEQQTTTAYSFKKVDMWNMFSFPCCLLIFKKTVLFTHTSECDMIVLSMQ